MHGAGKRRFSADSRMVSVVDYGVKNAVNLPLDYLVVPNNLLLSLIGAPSLISTPNTLSYAREDHHANPDKQRAQPSSLCSLFHAFFQLSEKGYKPLLWHAKDVKSAFTQNIAT